MARGSRGSSDWCAVGGDKCDQAITARAMHARVESLLTNRYMVLHPFTLSPLALHRAMFTDAEWTAAQLLQKSALSQTLLNFTWSVRVSTDVPSRIGRTRAIDLPLAQPVFAVRIHHDRLPDHLGAAVCQWVRTLDQFHYEADALTAAVKQLCGFCTSPGQIIRVWPALEGFFDDHVREELRRRKARSRLPLDLRDPEDIPPQLRYDALKTYDTALTEALLLPKYKHTNKELQGYPVLV